MSSLMTQTTNRHVLIMSAFRRSTDVRPNSLTQLIHFMIEEQILAVTKRITESNTHLLNKRIFFMRKRFTQSNTDLLKERTVTFSHNPKIH